MAAPLLKADANVTIRKTWSLRDGRHPQEARFDAPRPFGRNPVRRSLVVGVVISFPLPVDVSDGIVTLARL